MRRLPYQANIDCQRVWSGTLESNLGGREDLIATFISNGTERMPGFKYTYNTAQIAAIAAYIKTLPPGTQDSAAHTSGKTPVPVQ